MPVPLMPAIAGGIIVAAAVYRWYTRPKSIKRVKNDQLDNSRCGDRRSNRSQSRTSGDANHGKGGINNDEKSSKQDTGRSPANKPDGDHDDSGLPGRDRHSEPNPAAKADNQGGLDECDENDTHRDNHNGGDVGDGATRES